MPIPRQEREKLFNPTLLAISCDGSIMFVVDEDRDYKGGIRVVSLDANSLDFKFELELSKGNPLLVSGIESTSPNKLLLSCVFNNKHELFVFDDTSIKQPRPRRFPLEFETGSMTVIHVRISLIILFS